MCSYVNILLSCDILLTTIFNFSIAYFQYMSYDFQLFNIFSCHNIFSTYAFVQMCIFVVLIFVVCFAKNLVFRCIEHLRICDV